MTTILQGFSSSTVLNDKFTQSNPASGTFTWNNTIGLSSSPGISVSLGSDQVWTTKEGYTISEDGEYSVSAFFQSSANNGYGALGFSIQSQDSNAGSFGAPGGSHIGAFFHGGGGGFLNNGAIDTAGASTNSNSPISWDNVVQPDGSWYNFIFTVAAQGSNKYDLNLKIYNATASGVVGSLVTEHSMTDDMSDPAREGPAITNANVGGASTLHTFFSADGSRMTSIDNFQIDLSGDTLLLEPGPPLVDLNGSGDGANNAATFTEVTGADDGSAAVSFTTGASNLGDLDSANLSNLKISLPVSDVVSGDQLLLGGTAIDITGTAATGEVSYNSTFFSYAIVDVSGTRTVTFTSLNGSGGAATAAPIADFEALLDAAKFNNTSDSPADNATRTFSVTANDGTSDSSPATFTVTAVNADPELAYDTTILAEAGADDGSIGNSITITLVEDTFAGTNGDSLGTVSNVPDGLTATLVRASDTTATLSLTGNATAHLDTDNVTNLTVIFSDANFTNSTAANVVNATVSNLIIDYTDNTNNAQPVIKGKSSVTGNQNTAININGFTVSDDDNPSYLTVKIAASHGSLALNTTTGITGTTSGDTIQFAGSIADLNTALNSLSYQSDLEYSGTDDLVIQVSDDNGVSWRDYFVDEVGKFYYPLNEHYYEFVSASGITWTAAKTAAESKTLYGLNGYLVTVTSAAENSFIAPKLGGEGWMGASDASVEDTWRWETGPESGTQFWSGDQTGSPVNGEYNNWLAGDEPNDSSSNEDYAHFLSDGKWNDYRVDNPNITGYVVEYGGDGTGGDGFGTLQSVPLTVTVNAVNDAPVINNLDGDSVSTNVNTFKLLDVGADNTITDVDTTDFNNGTLVITTASGTADGDFALDGTNAMSGGDDVIAAGETVSVGGTNIGTVHATNDGQGGNTLTITLNANATKANVATLLKNIGYTTTTVGVREFNLTISESDGKNDSADVTFTVTSKSSSGGSGNTKTSTVDGVVIESTTTINNGVSVETVTVPIITNTRVEDPSTIFKSHADIPLVTDSDGQPVLQVNLPIGVGLSSELASDPETLTLRERLIAATDPKVIGPQIFNEILENGIDPYVGTVVDEAQVTLRTITFSVDASTLSDLPIVINGAMGTGEDNQDHPLRQEALVIDLRNLPAGTELQLDNTEFAIIIGSGRVVGGEGRNFVVGDDANQFVVLGADDDQLSGGFGDDTIGSKGGDDQLFGDEGHDYLIGGIGNDMLDGGEGDDLLQGGQSDAGTWTFSLYNQTRVVSTFTIDDIVFSTSSMPIIQSSWFLDDAPITNDSRVAFVYQDPVLLETISTLYQAVFQQLPTTEEINYWTQRGLTDQELAETAYQAYLNNRSDIQAEPLAAQMSQLISDVWGDDYVSQDWINKGLEYINNGGRWSEVLLFMARHDHLKQAMLDDNGDLKLTQSLQTSEIGWSTDTGSDTLIGGPGDDTLVGGRGHNLLNGGTGVDSAVVIETASSYHFAINDEGKLGLYRDDENSINELIDVEHVVFSDQTLDVSASNLDAASLKNMAGLAHMINENTWTLDNLNQVNDLGMTTTEVARALMTTDRYLQHWDQLSNSDFVSKLSGTVLGAPLVGDDLDFWTDQLDQGTISREEVLTIAADVPRYQDILFANDGPLLL